MTSSYPATGPRSSELVTGHVSGGTSTSQTMVVGALTVLLDADTAGAPRAAHEQAALETHVLKPRAYAWPLADLQPPDWINTPNRPEPGEVEAAVEPRLGRPGVKPGL